jgi:diguanylate cyclase (GGDEF)-like protein
MRGRYRQPAEVEPMPEPEPRSFAGRWIGWAMAERRWAYLVIIALAVAMQAFLIYIDAFDLIYEYTRAHEEWELDEVFAIFIVATFALSAVLFLRARRLAEEIERRTAAESRANQLARHDPLTGLPNRRLFREDLERRTRQSAEGGIDCAVLVLDLDYFKPINDLYGHHAGDRLLQAVADRLEGIVRAEDTVARLGGDEFAIAASGRGVGEIALRLVDRLRTELAAPFALGDIVAEIGCSIGVALFPDDASDPDLLLRRADMAMYRAKTAGRGTHAFFDMAMDHAFRERATLEADLRRGLRNGEIVPFYQPLFELASKRLLGFEALARWRHPSRGILLPETFIQLAEDIGLIGDLMAHLLRRAIEDALKWDPRLRLSINVSPVQFKDKLLAERILAVLAERGFPAERLEVEITEAALVADVEAARAIMAVLKGRGVKIALDDFGTGYSSLHHLRELPFDSLKIDRSFVTSGREDAESAKIVTAIIGLSHNLGLPTTAEGVESADDAAWLLEQGCDLGQGFYFAQPMDSRATSAFIGAAQKADRVA